MPGLLERNAAVRTLIEVLLDLPNPPAAVVRPLQRALTATGHPDMLK